MLSNLYTRLAVLATVVGSFLTTTALAGAADGDNGVDWAAMTTGIKSEVLIAIASAMVLAILILSVKVGFRIYRHFAK
jgi:hypothetical protein